MLSHEETLNTFYKKIFDDFPALIWRAGLDMKCDYFNNTWLEFTGRKIEDELGDGWTSGVHPDDLSACVTTYVENFKVKKRFDMQYRLKNAQGEYRWIRDIGRPFYDHTDRFVGYIGSCYDCTEERLHEERLDEINRAKDTFFSLVAHDLIGPMSAIESLTSLLEKELVSCDAATLAELIHELSLASSNLNSFLGEILDWARSQFQGIRISPERLKLDELVSRAIAPLLATAGIKGISLRTSVAPGLEVLADAEMTKTVVRNIVSNAIKFTLPGGTIDIAGEASGARASIRISDTGIGMDEELLASVFNIDASKRQVGTAGEKGSGLGLVICKEFVERNGGTITAESRRGAGSVFLVNLPAT